MVGTARNCRADGSRCPSLRPAFVHTRRECAVGSDKGLARSTRTAPIALTAISLRDSLMNAPVAALWATGDMLCSILVDIDGSLGPSGQLIATRLRSFPIRITRDET